VSSKKQAGRNRRRLRRMRLEAKRRVAIKSAQLAWLPPKRVLLARSVTSMCAKFMTCIQPRPRVERSNSCRWSSSRERTYMLAWAARGPRLVTLGTLPSRSPQAWARCAREGVIHGDRNTRTSFFGWFESICSYPIPFFMGTFATCSEVSTLKIRRSKHHRMSM
jgi:hypothetical protein